jgi:hypothetical protein
MEKRRSLGRKSFQIKRYAKDTMKKFELSIIDICIT